ncbi:MAG: hypothetical protein ACM31C_34480 [Acidobacteriota bacterium]
MWLWLLLLGCEASADPLRLRLERLPEAPDEPALHLDLPPLHSSHAEAGRSYELGPFRLAMTASIDRLGDSTHRVVGLFAYHPFRLSRWMRAWIGIGLWFEQTDDPGVPREQQGMTVGISLGTTFR